MLCWIILYPAPAILQLLFVGHLRPLNHIFGHSKVNVIACPTTTGQRSGHILDASRSVGQATPRPTIVSIAASTTAAHPTVPCPSEPAHVPSTSTKNPCLSFTKARFCKQTRWRCRRCCQMPLSPTACHCRLTPSARSLLLITPSVLPHLSTFEDVIAGTSAPTCSYLPFVFLPLRP